MKATLVAAALVATAQAQIDWKAFDAAPKAEHVRVPIGGGEVIIKYDKVAAAAAAVLQITNRLKLTLPPILGNLPILGGLIPVKRQSCQAQPLGAGPVPSPDTAEAFLAYADFAAAASAAPVPDGYYQTFSNLAASTSAYGYLGYTTLKAYDTAICASKCNDVSGCSAFNIYFERDPKVVRISPLPLPYPPPPRSPLSTRAVYLGTYITNPHALPKEPAASCPNPPSTTNIKCVFWGGPIGAENTKNDGQWRRDFHVVMAGSNGYVSNAIAPQPGYGGPGYLGEAAIEAPLDCSGAATDVPAAIFTSGPFDAGLCAAACSAHTAYSVSHPPADGSKPKTCQFFNTFVLLKNGVPEGQHCSMVRFSLFFFLFFFSLVRPCRLFASGPPANPSCSAVHHGLGPQVRDQHGPVAWQRPLHHCVQLHLFQQYQPRQARRCLHDNYIEHHSSYIARYGSLPHDV